MSATTLPPTRNSHEQSLVEYRSISGLALAALGLGLASALFLTNPLLAPIPLLAITVALVSMRAIKTSGGQVMGRAPAIVGLCLATFFLGWGVASRFSRAMTLEAHAREFAEGWLKLVAEGDLQQADQLRQPTHNRLRSADSRQEVYAKNPEAMRSLKDFFSTPPLSEFIAQGANVRIQYESLDSTERSAHYDRLVLRYSFRGPGPGSGPQPLLITVKRENHEGHTDWVVEFVGGLSGPGT
jgi:hypothetical protein